MRTSPVWLLVLALFSYGMGLFGVFVLDDYAIFSDPVLTSPSGWWEVWRLEQTRPLTYFTFWLNYQIGGTQAFGYHALNVSLHLLAVWLAFDALKRLLPISAAWVAAAIFATHPLQSEAVNYVFARSTLLMAVFCLLCLRDWLAERRWRSVVWFALALLAKEEAVSWPFFLVLLHWSLDRAKEEWKPLVSMFGLAALFGGRVLFTASTIPGSGAGLQAGVSAWDYFWTQGLVLWRYIVMALVPIWPYRIDSPVPLGFYWWGWLGILLVGALAFRRFKGVGVGFWVLAALVLLAPSSSVFPAADLSADRRAYLPMLAAGTALALSVPRVEYVVGVLVLLSCFRTWDWLDEERFWRGQAEGGSVRSMVQLARVVPSAEAVSLLEKARRENPEHPLVASELGRLYLTSGATDRALAEFGRALAMDPSSPQALSNRGVALLMLKQRDAARQDFEEALRLDPCTFEARLNAMRMGLTLAPAPKCRYTPEEQRALNGQ